MSFTGLGTGYSLGIEPEVRVRVDVAGRVLELEIAAELLALSPILTILPSLTAITGEPCLA